MITVNANLAYLLRVIVDSSPDQKIEQIKSIRWITGLGLKEAKDLIEAEHARRDPARNLFEEKLSSIIRQSSRSDIA